MGQPVVQDRMDERIKRVVLKGVNGRKKLSLIHYRDATLNKKANTFLKGLPFGK